MEATVPLGDTQFKAQGTPPRVTEAQDCAGRKGWEGGASSKALVDPDIMEEKGESGAVRLPGWDTPTRSAARPSTESIAEEQDAIVVEL